MHEEPSLVSNGVDVNFLSIVDKFRDNDGVKRRDRCGGGEIIFQRRFLVYHAHGCAGEDVGWTDKHWVPDTNNERENFRSLDYDSLDFCGEGLGSIESGHFSPFGLVNSDAV